MIARGVSVIQRLTTFSRCRRRAVRLVVVCVRCGNLRFDSFMDDQNKSLWGSLTAFVASLGTQLRAALVVGVERAPTGNGDAESVDPDFEAWVRNDPNVTSGSASRYRSQAPGYLTSNGRGSLEIGAADE